jgi:hypothetical protein
LCELESVEVVACSALQVAFTVDGIDVTAPPGYAPEPPAVRCGAEGGAGAAAAAAAAAAALCSVQCDPRGGAFGSEFIVVPDPAGERRTGTGGGGAGGGAGRLLLYLDVDLAAPKLWLWFVADAVRCSQLDWFIVEPTPAHSNHPRLTPPPRLTRPSGEARGAGGGVAEREVIAREDAGF